MYEQFFEYCVIVIWVIVFVWYLLVFFDKFEVDLVYVLCEQFDYYFLFKFDLKVQFKLLEWMLIVNGDWMVGQKNRFMLYLLFVLVDEMQFVQVLVVYNVDYIIIME